ncbi:nitrogen fixation protein [Proteiniclasticum sp. QWL-01]|uniref:nitrogen fixation protein n=1 Tax=Proteiniclasticum sp. QWL-01 TaxID=3036945 RepID=UPI00241123AA|nr:nitrogen fixation protein [Proteiniclasticum sp. QWL-01]WFF73541.1 nitrogen fixation protein [Proteiniclasticum sp. QWL-01]
MNKNTNQNIEAMVEEMTELYGDTPVELTFREVKEGIDILFGLMGLTVELVNLIREESELKKHHRAYLHVREAIDKCVAEVAEHISDTLDSFIDKEQMTRCGDFPFAEANDYDETVTLPKEKYDLMVEDLLTMAELIVMVSDMRTKDVRVIGELGKYVPAFAAFEKGRLSLYREAAKEAEEIVERWDEELDRDFEPDEYFSD